MAHTSRNMQRMRIVRRNLVTMRRKDRRSGSARRQPNLRAARRLDNHAFTKQLGVGLHKPAKNIADILPLAARDQEGRRRILDIAEKDVFGEKESKKRRLQLCSAACRPAERGRHCSVSEGKKCMYAIPLTYMCRIGDGAR